MVDKTQNKTPFYLTSNPKHFRYDTQYMFGSSFPKFISFPLKGILFYFIFLAFQS